MKLTLLRATEQRNASHLLSKRDVTTQRQPDICIRAAFFTHKQIWRRFARGMGFTWWSNVLVLVRPNKGGAEKRAKSRGLKAVPQENGEAKAQGGTRSSDAFFVNVPQGVLRAR